MVIAGSGVNPGAGIVIDCINIIIAELYAAFPDYKSVHMTARMAARGCEFMAMLVDQAMVDKAHAHGIRCNVFYADDPEEAKWYLDMGIGTILTNNYRVIAKTLEEYKKLCVASKPE